MLLPLSKIRTDGGTQPREKIDYPLVQEYEESYKAGAKFPPVVVFYDGKHYWLADGFHRVSAIPATGAEEIEAEVKQGTLSDAVWYSCGANAAHGLMRTNADKRRAVETALQHPKAKKLSARQVAEHCAVGHNLVAEIKRSLSSDDSEQPRLGKDGRNQKPASKERSDAAKKRAQKPKPEPVTVANEDSDAETARDWDTTAGDGIVDEPPSYDWVANQFLALVDDALLLTIEQQDSLIRLLASRIGSKRSQ